MDLIEDPYLQMIADAGALFAGTEIRITHGRPNECHRNAALSWLKGKCARSSPRQILMPVWAEIGRGVRSATGCTARLASVLT